MRKTTKKITTIILALVMMATLVPSMAVAEEEAESTIVVYDAPFNFSSATIDGGNVGGSNELILNLDSSAAVEGAQIKVYAVRYIPAYNSTAMPSRTNIARGTLRVNEIGYYFNHYKAIPYLAADVTVDLTEGVDAYTVRLGQILDQTRATKIEVILPAGIDAAVALEGAPLATKNVPGIDYALLHTLTPSAATAMNNLVSVVPDEIRLAANASSFSLAKQYEDFFKIGNVTSGLTATSWAAKHYNIYTAENNHKPSYLMNANGGFTLPNLSTDSIIALARNTNSNLIGHVLLWHGQSQNNQHPGPNATRAQSMQRMENYIKTVVQHFNGAVFPATSPRAGEMIFEGWDVVNEAYINEIPYVSEDDLNTPGSWKKYLRHSAQTVDGWENAPGSGTGHNGGQANRYHWHAGFANGANAAAGESGADFIYWGFVFARRYTDVQLIYNDFNIYEEGKAQMVAQMVKELNAKYAEEQPNAEFFGGPDTRQLIDVVGMQGHWYLQDTPARDPQRGLQRALEILREAGVKVHITELDLFMYFDEGAPGSNNTAALKNRTGLLLDNRAGNDGTAYPYWRTRFGLNVTATPPANFGKYLEAVQAEVYAELFMVLKENADIVDRVTFWGLRDTNSWRARHAPLLWYADVGGAANPKLAYYAVAFPEAFLGLPEITVCDAYGHDFDAGAVTDPTCSEGGFTTYTCVRCDYAYDDDFVDALGHDYVAVSAAVSNTNLQNNTTVTILVNGECSRCGDAVVLASASVKLKQSGTQTVKVGDYSVTVVVNGNNKITSVYLGAVAGGGGGGGNQNGNSQGNN